MSYKQAVFANGEFYHVFNRGVEKRLIFLDKRDYRRFIEALYYYQFENPPTRFSLRNRSSLIREGKRIDSLSVEIVCYCLMPNHFHLLLKQVVENGVSIFLSKVANSHTKYFNTKYKRVGPLFQGSFKGVRMEDEEQLNHVSRYIHLNPLVDYLVEDLLEYEYSSYPEFLGQKSGFCKSRYVLDRFNSPSDYAKFVLDQEDYGRTIKQIERFLHKEY